jgi:hypothetical protein
VARFRKWLARYRKHAGVGMHRFVVYEDALFGSQDRNNKRRVSNESNENECWNLRPCGQSGRRFVGERPNAHTLAEREYE